MVLLYSFAVSVLTIGGLILHLAMELSLHWNPQFYLNPIPFHLTFASAYILGLNGNSCIENSFGLKKKILKIKSPSILDDFQTFPLNI